MTYTNPTNRKGTIGETIIRAHLEQRGGVIYAPTPGRAHVVDFMYQDPATGALRAVEVKCYPRLYTRPATGIDSADMRKYCELLDSQGLDTHLYFVDEIEQAIYAGAVSALRCYDDTLAGKTLFPLAALHLVRRLTGRELREIRKHSATDYAMYRQTRRYFDQRGAGR